MTGDAFLEALAHQAIAAGETRVTRHADGTTTWVFRPARERTDDDEHQTWNIMIGDEQATIEEVKVTGVAVSVDPDTGDTAATFTAIGRASEVPHA